MALSRISIRLRGLRMQVLLWTVLPVTILLIVFSLSGISSHQQSMQTLAADENARLVVVLARLIALQAQNQALQAGISVEQVPITALNLDQLFDFGLSNATGTFLLLDRQDGTVLFSKGELPSLRDIRQMPGIEAALAGGSGVLFGPDMASSDVTVYTSVPDRNWTLVSRQPWHSLTDPLIRFEEVMPFILVTAVFVSLLVLFFGLRYVAQPLQELGVRANEIGQGKFDATAQFSGGVREISDLYGTLNDMAERLQSYQASLQDYVHAITQTQEEERERVARELHDETVQTLIALGHKAQMVQRSLTRDPSLAGERIQEMRQMVAQAVDEVRRFSRALRPHYLEELGLVPALESLAQEVGTDIQVQGTPYRMNAEQELTCYRIAQEALNNARRHAQAQHITIEIRFEPAGITLQVRDDGRGFSIPRYLNDLTRSGHFGLIGMQERAQLAGGQFQITSQPGQGTTLRLYIPIAPDSSARS